MVDEQLEEREEQAPELDMNYEEVPDPIVVPAGEYDLRVTDAKYLVSSNDNPMYIINFEIMNEPRALPVTHFLMLPQKDDDPKTKYQRQLSIKKFCQGVGLTLDRPVIEDSIGAACVALLSVGQDSRNGEEINRIRKFVIE